MNELKLEYKHHMLKATGLGNQILIIGTYNYIILHS